MKMPFNKPFMVGKELRYIEEAVLNGHISGDGPFTKKCHALLEEKFEARKVLLTTSCTSALEMAALLCEVKDGDEVLMPSFTFVSTANAFHLRGAKPVFVDIRKDTLNIDERKIEGAVTERSKVIVPVHYAGVACAMNEIRSIASRHSLTIVEDAAQGINAKYGNRFLGTIGNLGCYSFHETKNIISGEGGALLINSEELIERAEIIREKGTNRSKYFRGEVDKYTWVDIGSSYLPSDLIAAFLYAQLEEIASITDKRQKAYLNYLELLHGMPEHYGIELPHTQMTNGHLFYILAKDETERDALLTHMKQNGICAVFHYVPLHSSPMGLKLGYEQGMLPITENISSRLIRLPLYYDLTFDNQQNVADCIESFYETRKQTSGLKQ
jgi:dTDP-4-amino-4,6-dideoxygalactose transaminase